VMATYAVGSTATVLAGAFNGEGDNAVSNTDSTILAVGRVTVRPIEHLDIGANVAAYSSDSTRYGVDGMFTSGPATTRVEYIGEHRAAGGKDDYGWYVIAAYRVEPHVQLVLRQEDLRRPAVPERRNIATTAVAEVTRPDTLIVVVIGEKPRGFFGDGEYVRLRIARDTGALTAVRVVTKPGDLLTLWPRERAPRLFQAMDTQLGAQAIGPWPG